MKLTGQIFRASGSAIEIAAPQAESGSKTPRFSMTAYTGAPIRQLFAEEPIVVDLQGMTIPNRSIPIRSNHSSRDGVGHSESVEKVKVDGKDHIVATGLISRDTEAAREAVISSQRGFPWQASIGASIERYEVVKAGATVVVNGYELSGPLIVARETTLAEISFVDLGADDNTEARIAASQRATEPEGSNMGKENNEGSGSTEIKASGTEKTTKIEATGVVDDLRSKAESAKLDAQRNAKIKASAERAMEARPEIADQILELAESAIEDKVDPSDFGLQMLRFSRDIPGVGSPRADRAPSGELIEAGLMLEIGIDENQVVAQYSEQTVEAVRRKYGGGIGLNEAMSIAANASGCSVSRIKAGNIEEAFFASFDRRSAIQAASTISLPSILSNVANKVAEAAFNGVDSSWQEIAAVGSLSDFKTKTTNSLTGDYKLKQVGASGEIEHAVPGEETYTESIDTFARLLDITRRDIINDNTGALLEVPQKLGRGGALSFNDNFWAVFLDDAAFFTSGRNNLLTGAGSALDVEALSAAFVALMTQTDPDGELLGLNPSDMVLLCPPALIATAKQLANSTELRGLSGSFGTSNPHQGTFKPVMSPYLTDATAWYLMAKPSVMPCIKAGFLNGRRRPVIETAQANFETLGIRARGVFDHGASQWEYRGAVKNEGA